MERKENMEREENMERVENMERMEREEKILQVQLDQFCLVLHLLCLVVTF